MESLRLAHVADTRRALVDAGYRMFSTQQYNDVSAEALVRTAGLTRGALYHHFAGGKRGLFEAVLVSEQTKARHWIQTRMSPSSDPFDRSDRGATAYLEVCADAAYRHIVLEQGPIALGWTRWREVDKEVLGDLVLDELRKVLDTQRLGSVPLELLAASFYGSLTELAFVIAASDDPESARAEAAQLQHELLAGLVKRPARD